MTSSGRPSCVIEAIFFTLANNRAEVFIPLLAHERIEIFTHEIMVRRDLENRVGPPKQAQ